MPMPRTTPDKEPRIYQIKVSLRGSQPPIWRRIQVPGNATLADLHQIIQAVMGWYDCHLHQFIIKDKYYGLPDPDIDFVDLLDESTVQLQQVVKRVKTKFIYEYDFGDGWEHVLEVEKLLPAEQDAKYPTCLTGKRACPPEDCGGIWGYYNLLDALGNPDHPEHETYREWTDGPIDPAQFDLAEANATLAGLAESSRPRLTYLPPSD